ncbi:MAG TPA: energy transducer TonB [Longimicrobium sp.]|jgi:TonB family protein
MFSVYVRNRKRRLWSPGTIVASVLAHVLLLAGAVSAGVGDLGPQDEPQADIEWIAEVTPKPVTPPPPPMDPTPPPPAPERPRIVEGDHREIENVETVPTELPKIDPNERPVDPREYSGEGRQAGNVIVPNPAPNPAPPAGDPQPSGNGEGPVSAEVATELPALANRAEAERLLRRYYPPLLRESGMTGRTVVTLIIDAEGRVEPGSVSVQETSHPAFAEPAVKVAEKMRFRPAKLGREPISVIIAIPIEWRLEN